MKAFWTYTLARFAVFLGCYVVAWLVVGLWLESNEIVNIWVLLVALVVSSIISLLTLGKLRENLARTMQSRAEKINDRIEESRRAEDVD